MSEHVIATTIGLTKQQAENLKIVDKEWGKEVHVFNHKHCVKLMELKPGYQCSMHWHKDKEETFVLIQGELIVETTNKAGQRSSVLLTERFSTFTLLPNVPHTFYTPKDQVELTYFIEASTTDNSADSYRIYPSGQVDWD